MSRSDELRARLVRNMDEIELRDAERAPLYASRGGRVIGPGVAGVVAQKLGASIDVVPPGKVTCPYHFHYAQEEMFIILQGEGTLRVGGERVPVRAGDVIAIPPGPEYPHQLINTSASTLKYLSISTQETPEVCEYPDSSKYLAYVKPAGPLMGDGKMHRADTDLDYWDGEP